MRHKTVVKWQAITTIMGSIMGAGLLGLPYAMAQAGFLNGLLLMLFLAFMIMVLHLMMGEIVLSSNHSHQLTGYANKYLGPVGRWSMFLIFMLASYGALLAYIVGAGDALSALLGGRAEIWSLVFFSIASAFLYIGLRLIKKIGLVLMFSLIAVILIMSLACIPDWHLDNVLTFNINNFFAPYGVILFALLGASAIYQARKVLEGHEKLLKEVIIISNLIPVSIYILFSLVVVGVTGAETSEVATVALGQVIGPEINFLANLFAFLTLTTSYLVLGNAVKETYFYDFDLVKDTELDRFVSWMFTISIPLFLFLLGNDTFINILSFVGAIAGGLEGIVIVLMYRKMKSRKNLSRKAEYTVKYHYIFTTLLFFIFLAGIVYQIIYK